MDKLIKLVDFCISKSINLILSESKESYWTPNVELVQQHKDELDKMTSSLNWVCNIIEPDTEYNPKTGKKTQSSAYFGLAPNNKPATKDELVSGIKMPSTV